MILFTIWMLLYPIMQTVDELIVSIRRKIDGEEKRRTDSDWVVGLFCLAIYIIVGVALYIAAIEQ